MSGKGRLLLHLGALVLLCTMRAELSSFILLPEPHSGIKKHEIQLFPVILVYLQAQYLQPEQSLTSCLFFFELLSSGQIPVVVFLSFCNS